MITQTLNLDSNMEVSGRPGYALTQPSVEPWEMVVLVADMIEFPVATVKLAAAAGRFCVLDYKPIQKPDPTLVLMVGEGNEEFNRLVKRILALKGRQANLYPAEWLKLTRPYLDTALEILEKVGALPDERRLVMTWFAGIVCQMK